MYQASSIPFKSFYRDNVNRASGFLEKGLKPAATSCKHATGQMIPRYHHKVTN